MGFTRYLKTLTTGKTLKIPVINMVFADFLIKKKTPEID